MRIISFLPSLLAMSIQNSTRAVQVLATQEPEAASTCASGLRASRPSRKGKAKATTGTKTTSTKKRKAKTTRIVEEAEFFEDGSGGECSASDIKILDWNYHQPDPHFNEDLFFDLKNWTPASEDQSPILDGTGKPEKSGVHLLRYTAKGGKAAPRLPKSIWDMIKGDKSLLEVHEFENALRENATLGDYMNADSIWPAGTVISASKRKRAEHAKGLGKRIGNEGNHKGNKPTWKTYWAMSLEIPDSGQIFKEATGEKSKRGRTEEILEGIDEIVLRWNDSNISKSDSDLTWNSELFADRKNWIYSHENWIREKMRQAPDRHDPSRLADKQVNFLTYTAKGGRAKAKLPIAIWDQIKNDADLLAQPEFEDQLPEGATLSDYITSDFTYPAGTTLSATKMKRAVTTRGKKTRWVEYWAMLLAIPDSKEMFSGGGSSSAGQKRRKVGGRK